MEATMDVKTRSQKKMIGQPLLDDPKAILNNIGENQAEAQELVEDRIFHDFVENVVDPDKCILDNVEDNDFVPNDDSIIDAEDGGSSEDELDKEEETGSGEDQEAVITEGQAANIQGVPPVLAQAYKKRFPNFWRTQQGLVNNLGRAYDQEEDPDFVTADEAEDEDSDSESSSDDDCDVDIDDDEIVNAKGAEVEDLAVMVEDMAIPDEEGDAHDVDEDDDHEDDGEAGAEEEMSFVQEISDDHLKDYQSEEDPDFEPVEVQDSSEHESELSSDEDEDLSEDNDAEEGDENEEENMDE